MEPESAMTPLRTYSLKAVNIRGGLNGINYVQESRRQRLRKLHTQAHKLPNTKITDFLKKCVGEINNNFNDPLLVDA